MNINLDDKTWYEKLKILRLLNGWSQREAAHYLLTNQKHYWLWEKGKAYPNNYHRRRIAFVFSVKEEEIFN